ncbi:MAG: 2OG-Fe(II) oxygenase [Pseudomonadales bacterium]|nr:2OG-Fe(II) oxygenase [Pseudomonadales bacterium]
MSNRIKAKKMTHDSIENKLQTIAQSPLAFMVELKQKYEYATRQNPEDVDLFWQLGEINRALGNFEAAIDCYSQVLHKCPQHGRARYIASILQGRQHSVDRPTDALHCPAPFLIQKQFVSTDYNQSILSLAIEKESAFVDAKVGALAYETVDTTIRSTKILGKSEIGNSLAEFRKKIFENCEHWQKLLNVTPFTTGHIELSMLHYQNRQFYQVHKDQGLDETRSRTLTFIYFFYKQPKAFSGGELLLYDTDENAHSAGTAFTQIEPENNTLLVFPSQYFHQVTPVQSSFCGFDSGRFVINGFIHAVST